MKSILVGKPFLPDIDEYVEQLRVIWDSHWLTNCGQLHNEFESRIKGCLGVNNATLTVNGHSALDIAIKAFDLKGEVITTPFTFISTTHATTMNGLTPVFCDINPDDFTIDAGKIEELITGKTSAIVPVHTYGNPCDVYKIEEIAKTHGLKVIYDAAHCFGVEVDGVPIGLFGDASIFSFHATKVFHSIEGGALVYQDDGLKRKFEQYRNFGITDEGDIELIGLNAKMNEFQAAMGLVNLNYIDEQIERRKQITAAYMERLKDIPGIRTNIYCENVKYNYSYFPVIIDEKIYGLARDELCDKLKAEDIFARKYFHPLVTDTACYKNQYGSKALPNAKYISQRVLTLPLHSGLTEGEIEKICETIRK